MHGAPLQIDPERAGLSLWHAAGAIQMRADAFHTKL
jgi:hypothetical protein